MILTSILRVWFFGLFSFILIGAGIYCGHEWYRRSWSYDFASQRSYFNPHLGFNYPTFFLAVAVVLLLESVRSVRRSGVGRIRGSLERWLKQSASNA